MFLKYLEDTFVVDFLNIIKMRRFFFRFSLKAMMIVVMCSTFFLSSCDKDEQIDDQTPVILQFVYTSDSHFGITRAAFRKATDVPSDVVNRAMIKQINTQLAHTVFPADDGVNAGQKVGGIDFIVSSGDMANRAEPGCLPAIESWNQFKTVYIDGLDVKTDAGSKAPLYITPGNHDISNAIGHPKIPQAHQDASVMAAIYNYSITPTISKTAETYSYYADKVNYSKTVKGVHFLFLNIWPDTETRSWITTNTTSVNMPVVIFTHDQPDIESKHLMDFRSNASTNTYDFSSKFENLVMDKAPEGANTSIASTTQQEGLTAFLAANRKIKAYFHGNSNKNEFYTYYGEPVSSPAKVYLPVFRVDSPMKGDISSVDEKVLSFQVATINTSTMQMTVRECLWNTTASDDATLVWGDSRTISIK